jgi:hypothetical protein
VGIGASVALDLANNDTRAEIDDTAVVTTTGTTGNLNVLVASTHSAQVSAEAGAASSGGVAVAPAVGIAIENNNSEARFGSGATMHIGGAIDVLVTHGTAISNVDGGTSAGSDAAIGASVAVTVANDTTLATTDRDITAGGAISFTALAAAASNSTATASASGAPGTGSSSSTPDQEVTQQRGFGDNVASQQGVGNSGSSSDPKAQTSDGSVTVAAAVAVNIANSSAQALLPANRIITSGGAFTLEAGNHTDATADASGAAVQGGKQAAGGNSGVSIGAAVALNLGNNSAIASVGSDAQVHSQGANFSALMTPDASGSLFSTMGATAVAGAGGGDIGVAGAVAINIENSTSQSIVSGGALVNAGAGAITMATQNNTLNTTSATPTGGGGSGSSVGIGASLALDLANNTTDTEIADTAVVTTTGSLTMTAASLHGALITAETGAASTSSVAVAPAVGLAIENNTTSVLIGSG